MMLRFGNGLFQQVTFKNRGGATFSASMDQPSLTLIMSDVSMLTFTNKHLCLMEKS